jgi:hypothetical protein
MKFMIIDNDLQKIALYDKVGVDRLFIDLEIIGKQQRQGNLDTVISNHTMKDVAKAKLIVKHMKLLVRTNPIHTKSGFEIEEAINSGADILMLPMFTTTTEVAYFVDKIGGRAKVSLLLETPQALSRIDDILAINGIDEIHVGLNDLHLAMRLAFMFELVSGGLVEYLANKIRARAIAFGFGGVATLDGGDLPGGMVLSQHVRLGSECVILSRSFKKIAQKDEENFRFEFVRLRERYSELKKLGSIQIEELTKDFRMNVSKIVNRVGINV